MSFMSIAKPLMLKTQAKVHEIYPACRFFSEEAEIVAETGYQCGGRARRPWIMGTISLADVRALNQLSS